MVTGRKNNTKKTENL